MRRVSTSEARKELAELINRVAYAQDRVLIGRRGKELAALIPIADLRLLERFADDLEDRLDAEDALRVEADASDPSLPWEHVKGKCGLSGRGQGKRPARARQAAPAHVATRRRRTRRAR